jgi:HPt (histidine-containing phosphotransfer) domain-containing protein
MHMPGTYAPTQLAPMIIIASLLLLGGVLGIALIDRQLRLKRRLIEAEIAERQELVALFRVEGPRRLTDLRRALIAGDVKGVESAAHGLKGSVSSLKAKRSFDAAEAVELLARRKEMQKMEAACATLEDEIAQLQRALATFAGAA